MREAGRRGARFVGPNEPELIEGVGTYALSGGNLAPAELPEILAAGSSSPC